MNYYICNSLIVKIMRNFKGIKISMLCCIVMLFITSCEKTKDNIQKSIEVKKVVFTDAAIAEMNFLSAYGIFDKAANNVSKSFIIDSAHVWLQGDTLFIDYGTGYVNCPDGHRRKGKMTAVFSDFTHYDQAGTIVNIDIENLYDNDYCLNGTVLATNQGVFNNRIRYEIIANQGTSLIGPNGTINFVAVYYIEWDRNNTPAIDDDKMYILTTSSSTGLVTNGSDFTMSVENQMVLDYACPYKIIEGRLKLASTRFPEEPSFIDFGSGACDDKLQLILNTNGITTTIDYTIDQLF